MQVRLTLNVVFREIVLCEATEPQDYQSLYDYNALLVNEPADIPLFSSMSPQNRDPCNSYSQQGQGDETTIWNENSNRNSSEAYFDGHIYRPRSSDGGFDTLYAQYGLSDANNAFNDGLGMNSFDENLQAIQLATEEIDETQIDDDLATTSLPKDLHLEWPDGGAAYREAETINNESQWDENEYSDTYDEFIDSSNWGPRMSKSTSSYEIPGPSEILATDSSRKNYTKEPQTRDARRRSLKGSVVTRRRI